MSSSVSRSSSFDMCSEHSSPRSDVNSEEPGNGSESFLIVNPSLADKKVRKVSFEVLRQALKEKNKEDVKECLECLDLNLEIPGTIYLKGTLWAIGYEFGCKEKVETLYENLTEEELERAARVSVLYSLDKIEPGVLNREVPEAFLALLSHPNLGIDGLEILFDHSEFIPALKTEIKKHTLSSQLPWGLDRYFGE